MNLLWHRGAAVSVPDIGGKAASLQALSLAGLPVPPFFVLTTRAYRLFVLENGLDAHLRRLVHARDLSSVRWEQLWDIALELGALFRTAPVPDEVARAMRLGIAALEAGSDAHFPRSDSPCGSRPSASDAPLAVRSSAPGEDASAHSFAGLHESVVPVSGLSAALEAVREVWASLWSDRALLYRRERAIPAVDAAMAVVVQQALPGRVSGVVFTQSPQSPSQMLLEAAPGQGQALMDGLVRPERWRLDRDTVAVIAREDTPGQSAPLLTETEATRIARTALKAQDLFACPQDVEWTLDGDDMHVLQSRPVTARPVDVVDEKSRHQSLRPSLQALKALRREIEEDILPGMARTVAAFSAEGLDGRGRLELAEVVQARLDALVGMREVYWRRLVPMAHGARLFAEFHNRLLKPSDPFAFLTLLKGQDLLSIRRNLRFARLAELLRTDKALAAMAAGRNLIPDLDPEFTRLFTEALADTGELACGLSWCEEGQAGMLGLLLEMAAGRDAAGREPGNGHGASDGVGGGTLSDAETALTRAVERSGAPGASDADEDGGSAFLLALPEAMRADGGELLDLGRASYRLRDDDNIVLGRMKAELNRAVRAGLTLLEREGTAPNGHATSMGRVGRSGSGPLDMEPERAAQAVLDALRGEERTAWGRDIPDEERHRAQADRAFPAAPPGRRPAGSRTFEPLAAPPDRSLFTGAPASPGLARGPARVIVRHEDLLNFRKGHILVCESLDPAMTFVVPLCAAIVERRGGMLVHGAIIAREYGVACVTGVEEAVGGISTGDLLEVDGFLGRVRVLERADAQG